MKITGYRCLRSFHDWGRPVGDVNGFVESGITEVPIVILETDDRIDGDAPHEHALFAASGPANPSMAPLPNSSGCLLTPFSTAYDMKVAMVPPAPGNTPTRKPSGVPRTIGMNDCLNSFIVTQTLPILL